MSSTRRERREAGRQQAQQRLRRMLAARHKGTQEQAKGLRRFTASLMRRRTLYFLVALVLALIMAFPLLAAPSLSPSPVPTSETPQVTEPTPTATPSVFSAPGPDVILPESSYTAVLQTTRGSIKAELNTKKAPISAGSFVFLSKNNYYQDTPVLEVEQGKLAEAGIKDADGTGGPGYSIPATESGDPIRIGSLVMVADDNNAVASRFRIALTDLEPTRPGDTVIGRVIDGLDIARQLTTSDRIIGIQIVEQ